MQGSIGQLSTYHKIFKTEFTEVQGNAETVRSQQGNRGQQIVRCPNVSQRDLRGTGCYCIALVGKSPRCCDMCTIHSQCSSGKETWTRRSVSSGQKCDLPVRRGTGRTGTCNCLSVTTKGPRGAVTCARSSPNCCQTCDGSVTWRSSRLDSQGTCGRLEWSLVDEGSRSGVHPGPGLTCPPQRAPRHQDARRSLWRRASCCCSGASCAFAGSLGGCSTCRSP